MRLPIAFVSQLCGSMNDGHGAFCNNMELLYSENLFHFGLLYLQKVFQFSMVQVDSVDWCRRGVVAYRFIMTFYSPVCFY